MHRAYTKGGESTQRIVWWHEGQGRKWRARLPRQATLSVLLGTFFQGPPFPAIVLVVHGGIYPVGQIFKADSGAVFIFHMLLKRRRFWRAAGRQLGILFFFHAL